MKKKYDISKEDLKNWLSEGAELIPSEDETNLTEDALINFAKAHSLTPPFGSRNKILEKIAKLEKQKNSRQPFGIDTLPHLDESANWLDWEEAVRGIEPPQDFENVHLHPLESNENRDLFVAWVKVYIEEEVHHDILESFLILEGSCECHITGKDGTTRIVKMGKGDFITMQLGETHDIVITSREPAKAILQWKKLAA